MEAEKQEEYSNSQTTQNSSKNVQNTQNQRRLAAVTAAAQVYVCPTSVGVVENDVRANIEEFHFASIEKRRQ